jgi:hypothetical protein
MRIQQTPLTEYSSGRERPQITKYGCRISAGKMSGLWSGQPNTVRLDELDVICAVLGCDVGELLLPGPVAAPEPHPARAPALSRKLAPSRPGPGPAGPCHPGDRAIRMRMAACPSGLPGGVP